MEDGPIENLNWEMTRNTGRFLPESTEESGAVKCYQSKHYILYCAHPQASSTPFHAQQGPGCVRISLNVCIEH